MCSWCYAFKPVLQQLRQQLETEYAENLRFECLLGGLAADIQEPMPAEMRQQLRATWQRIEQKVSDIQFNYSFWDNWQITKPRRSTYPACRAVIAAHSFDENEKHYYERLMIEAIQNTYYQEALNPSNDNVLVTLAVNIGLTEQAFNKQLSAAQTQQQLEQQISQYQQMNVRSYPSLILKIDNSYWPVSIDYLSSDSILETISMLLDFE